MEDIVDRLAALAEENADARILALEAKYYIEMLRRLNKSNNEWGQQATTLLNTVWEENEKLRNALGMWLKFWNEGDLTDDVNLGEEAMQLTLDIWEKK